ncbi:MAG: flagellar biosynthesis protein FlhA [Methanoregulaceae archaeon]|nr:flagellar biosynthesis protein FlhA [Methanoregulaceae archaeon]
MNSLSKILRQTDLLLGIGLLAIVGMLILPLPHWMLDTGLVIAMTASVVILLTSVNIKDPLEFSVFPSLLLITTLFRLALSIAATKLILGTGQAGHVIETFGNFVMGGDFVVGFVVFLILMIVQFIVITNGAGRVSEVVARFTLDAMPGKQMAIDADLAAGMIDEEEARARRKAVKQEADFYGAMDGASKFVKGDAIASILIILVNIVGGFAVGFLRGDADAMSILRTYALLSVGEGLVSQLPALLISTASGLMVTRAGQDRSMAGEVTRQLLNQHRSLGFAGGALAVLAFVPGFPATIFLSAAGLCFGLNRFLTKNPAALKQINDGDRPKDVPKAAAPAPTGPEAVLPLLTVDPIEIEIGYGLTRLADPRVGGDLSERVTATRRQIALDLGFVMPTVRIRDSVHLTTNEYCLKVKGEEVARAEVLPGHCLAISSGSVLYPLAGQPGRDPVFGLDALWIDPGQKETAERGGYTVIDPSAVISTHLSEVVKSYAPELLSRQDVHTLIDNAKHVNEAVVNELVPHVLQLGDVQKVLQHLLRERVPIRDMVTILETMADFGSRVKDPDQLGELVRAAIARTITRQFLDHENRLTCITMEPSLERSLTESLSQTPYGAVLAMDPNDQRRMMDDLQSQVESAMAQGYQPVLLCGNQLRLPMRRLLEKYIPNLYVLAYNEVAAQAEVEFVGQLRAA